MGMWGDLSEVGRILAAAERSQGCWEGVVLYF